MKTKLLFLTLASTIAGCANVPVMAPSPNPDAATVEIEQDGPFDGNFLVYTDSTRCNGPLFFTGNGGQVRTGSSAISRFEPGPVTIQYQVMQGHPLHPAGVVNCSNIFTIQAAPQAAYRVRANIDGGRCVVAVDVKDAAGWTPARNYRERVVLPPIKAGKGWCGD